MNSRNIVPVSLSPRRPRTLPIRRRPHSRRRPRPPNDRREGGRGREEPEHVSFLTKQQILF